MRATTYSLCCKKLLLKASIEVKKAQCDWDRYKEFKPTMHEAAFELIEISHDGQSGENSADINESYYGFNEILEETQARGQPELEMDEKSGGYVIRSVTREL